MTEKTCKIHLEIRDVPGGLVRVAQVFSRRGANIDSIHVERPENSIYSDMIITAKVKRVEQIVRQLEKLVDVNKVKLL